MCLLELSGEEIRGHQDTQSMNTHKRKWAGCREKDVTVPSSQQAEDVTAWAKPTQLTHPEPPEYREGNCTPSRLPAPTAQFQTAQPEH